MAAFVVLLIAAAPDSTAIESMEWPRVVSVVDVAAVGDVLMHVPVQASAANHGYGDLFEGVKADLGAPDITFANLETPLAPKHGQASRPFVFNASPKVLTALLDAGVDVVSFANNHVYDQGRKGFVETLDHLDESGVVYVGAGRTCPEAAAPQYIYEHGVLFAFLGTSVWYNANNRNRGPDVACSFAFDEAKILESAAAARAAGADTVVLSIHWGLEYRTKPRVEDVQLAHRLLDGGVDVILGHHPHVLQPVEAYRTRDGRDTIVAYSLGNFISNQSYDYAQNLHPAAKGHTRDGMILHFQVVRREYGDGTVRTELAGLRAQPLWTQNDYLECIRNPKKKRTIRVVDTVRARTRVLETLAEARDPREIVKLQRELRLYEAREFRIERVVGADVVTPVSGSSLADAR